VLWVVTCPVRLQAIIQIAALLPAEDLHGIEGLKHEAIAVIFRCDHCTYVKAWGGPYGCKFSAITV